MAISQKQFDVLVCLEQGGEKINQRGIAAQTGMSLGSVNRVLGSLVEAGMVSGYQLTQSGYEALEPYRAKRAVFIAAGFGSRMVPVTLNTPKPLVRVNGKRIIDSLIDAVLAADIKEIYIVRGYLGEQFDQLLYKYPMIKFLENPDYNESNNISSALCARHLLSNAYVLEADLLLKNPAIIRKYNYHSNYLSIPMERSDDWCFTVKDNVITSMVVGGMNCYQVVGISYWNGEDGAKLAEHIKLAYEMPGGKERFWDSVALSAFADEYKIRVRECKSEDVVEIDTFRELKALDPAYDA